MPTRAVDNLHVLDGEHPIQGEPVAQLALGYEDLADRVHLPWREGADELGRYHELAVEVPKYGGFGLVSYADAPERSTVVFGSPGIGLTRALDELLARLQVSSAEVIDRVDRAAVEQTGVPASAPEDALREGAARQMEDLRASMNVMVQRILALTVLQAEDMSGRQREIAILLASGLTHEEIADQLDVTQRTVDRYVQRVLHADLLDSYTLAFRAESPRRRSRARQVRTEVIDDPS